MTRSAYGPGWDLEANRRRLAMTKAVTAPLMGGQTFRDWTWIVALDPRDPLLEERRAVFEAAAPRFVAMMWTPTTLARVPWDPEPKRHVTENELIAAAAYRAPWRSFVPGDGPLLQTRLDDDDGLALDGLARYQRAARVLRNRRAVLMLPMGVRVYGGRFASISHDRNAMHTLHTPAGDDLCIYDYGHTKCRHVAPVLMVDHRWGWVWTRHHDTISGWRETRSPLTPRVRAYFPVVDWAAVAAAT